MSIKQSKIAFIGGGNMAAAIVQGLLKQGHTEQSIIICEPNAKRAEWLKSSFNVPVTDSAEVAVSFADAVVLAVKPQVMLSVIEPLAQTDASAGKVFISIAAGINIALMEGWLGKETAVVRCMPNTPSLLREGATALFANGNVSDQQREQALAILQAVGLALWVNKESELDTVTALSGSGPAYFFLMMELMQQAGEKLGLSAEVSQQLTLQTAFGSAKMAIDSDVDVAELPASRNGFVTFGSFHSLAKISDLVIETWCEILHQTPNSKLFFKCKELVDIHFREHLIDRCKRLGIEQDRLIMEEGSPLSEYFEAYNRVDIGLDPFPYNSGTVGYHSLWMGVPYIALQGDRILSRIGYSNLSQVGLNHLVADDRTRYVDVAVDLASNIEQLAFIRKGLREVALNSALFDGKKMADELEHVFKEMWQCFVKKSQQ